jgi:hypothetical protein
LAIDDLIPQEWPPDVAAALDAWRQGHLIAADRGVWLAPADGGDPVTGDTAPGTVGDLRGRSGCFGDTGYMAVISQTCDIAVAGPGRRHPFVQACPVRDIGKFSDDKIQQIKSGAVVEYVFLSQPPASDALWAVDLRATVPVSKAVLAATAPIEGFANEEDELALAARITDKFERPAIHDVLTTTVLDSLRRCLSRAKKQQSWCDDIEQLRLDIMEGTRLQPKRVRLLVYTDVALGPGDKKTLREEWKSHKSTLKEAGIEWTAIAFRVIDKCSLKEYRESIPIAVPTLDRGRFV